MLGRVLEMLLGGRCLARSPEGYICTREYGHGGLHLCRRGRGYAWGGSHYNKPKGGV